jgi:hypothetical protein
MPDATDERPPAAILGAEERQLLTGYPTALRSASSTSEIRAVPGVALQAVNDCFQARVSHSGQIANVAFPPEAVMRIGRLV